ncbi:hypothetical protein E2562_032883 [Oryza meyeriana var. granulata]|uniref:Uncharacterized protein n=1 Tax=Oryza meyeriana var. granulata TaxID=110450 RepID=A0A6G1F0P6_9ORYZ|nr:hypothetical protein E2562_032883 [Oryza meyeriana var. granulata]
MADPRLFPSGSNSSGDRHGASAPGRRQYNPYHDLNTPYNYRTLYDLPTSPEFLFQEESAAQRRSWGENLTYYTGVGYLSGIESDMVAARERDDWINSVAAGLGTGALFRAANGPRSAAVAGAIGGVLAGAAMDGKQLAKRYVPAI